MSEKERRNSLNNQVEKIPKKDPKKEIFREIYESLDDYQMLLMSKDWTIDQLSLKRKTLLEKIGKL